MRWLLPLLFLCSVLGTPHGRGLVGEPPDTDPGAEISVPEAGERGDSAADQDPAPDDLGCAKPATLPASATLDAAFRRSRAEQPDTIVGSVPVPPPIA